MNKKITKTISLFILTTIILLTNTIVAFADTPTYAQEDVAALSSFLAYDNNADELDWDLNAPDSINEIIWELEDDGLYHIVEISLSNLDVSGIADFSACEYLDSVSFSNTNITSANLPENVISLGSTSFYNCSSLICVEINANEISIGRNAFSGCNNLKSFINADRIISVGTNGFRNCINLKFYGINRNSYGAQYAASNRISFSTDFTVTAYCYLGIMTDKNIDYIDLTGSGIGYHTGYITTDCGTFYANTNGLVEIDIPLGHNQNVVIDGTTALTRTASFDVLCNNYYISTQNKAIGIVVCNYVKDSLINGKDYAALTHYTVNSNNTENYCYDIDGNNVIDSVEQAYFQEFIATASNQELVLYTSWR